MKAPTHKDVQIPNSTDNDADSVPRTEDHQVKPIPMDDDQEAPVLPIGGDSNGVGVHESDRSTASAIIGNQETTHLGSRVHKAVLLTPHKVSSATRHVSTKVGAAAKTTLHKTKEAIHMTEDVVENNKWCFAARCILHLPRTWPRTFAFFFWVCLPIWLLILLSMGFGVLLAQYESFDELSGNDDILAARAQLRLISDRSPVNRATELGTLLRQCVSEVDLADDSPGNGLILATRLEICALANLPEVDSIFDVASNNSLAFESLSFNWNRCWNSTLYDSNFPFHPSDEIVEAVRPESQENFYKEAWDVSQQAFYAEYRPENATVEEERQAFLRSIQDATAVDACRPNTAGTAWFFFTIMTTVGYGNQAPVTYEGRVLVATAGLFCVVMFAALLGLAGFTLLAIFDDCVARIPCGKVLTYPGVGILVWGSVWLLYAVSTATDVQKWWDARLPEFGASISREDAMWFAYISTSTIGLGDLFLQPEVIFASDTLKYSVTFMIGFIFLSTFFGKIAEALAWMLPRRQDSFQSRLRATRVLAFWKMGLMPWETAASDSKPSGIEETNGDVMDTLSTPEDIALAERIKLLRSFAMSSTPTPNSDGDPVAANANESTNTVLLEMQKGALKDLLDQIQAKLNHQLETEQRPALDALPEGESEESIQV